MASEKRFYWLKLMEGFFDETYIKALRKMPAGDAMVIVYLKIQLKSLRTEGIIEYQSIMPNQAEEIAVAINEDPIIVKATIEALKRIGIIEEWDNDTLYMAAMQSLIGSESSVSARVRKHRAIQKELEMLHCNAIETKCNTEIEIDKETEKELEQEKEITIVASNDAGGKKPPIDYEQIRIAWNNLGLAQVTKITPSSARHKAIKARVREYGIENVFKAIQMVGESDFLKGYKTDFVATFDWIFKPKNFPKVLEGNYTNSDKNTTSVSNKIQKFNSMYSHNYNFDQLEEMQDKHLDMLLKGKEEKSGR